MAAESDTDNEPRRPPVLNDSSLGWAESANREAQERSALQHVRANHEVRQRAAAEDKARQLAEIDTQSAQQTGAQPSPKAEVQAEASITGPSSDAMQGLEPQLTTGSGQDRPQGTYEALKLATPAQEYETETEADAGRRPAGPSAPEPDGQQSTEPPSTMTARERHEARLQAYLQGDRQEREAERKDAASDLGGTDASIKEEQEQETLGTPSPHLGGGMSR
jgi:hypothetical protein